MAQFLRERLLFTSDSYSTYVCEVCGLFAQRVLKKENRPYAGKQDIFMCPSCNNKTKIAKVVIPYAFKLMLQELMALNIRTAIRIKQ